MKYNRYFFKPIIKLIICFQFLKQAATLSAKKGCAGIELALQQLINNIDQLTISEKTDTESSKSMALSISSTNATPYRCAQSLN